MIDDPFTVEDVPTGNVVWEGATLDFVAKVTGFTVEQIHQMQLQVDAG
jgi:hypothetical protein